MKNLAQRVAGGAVWMVGLRFVQRFIGLISTVILARLLIPEDFGIVAMAMTFYALLQMIGEFGFDLALIQNQKAERRHYDTAWTFNVGYRSLGALAMAAAAPGIAALFNEPRLEAVVYVIALTAFVQGLENIGIVAFRKDIEFHLEFHFQIAKKVIAFVVTVGLAFAFRNYWALVIGMLASHVAGTALSYWMHPYRPRFSLAGARDLFNFSIWVFLNSLVRYAKQRGPDLLIGRFGGAGALGIFKIAYELATLPTSELRAPIMRATFPGFSKISHNLPRLRNAYLSVQGVVATLTIPAGVGVIMLAEPLVYLLLGTKWLAAIPLIEIIGLYGVLQILNGNHGPLFMALGQPWWMATENAIHTSIALPLLGVALHAGHGIEGVSWALVIAACALLPIGLGLVWRVAGISPQALLAVQGRPLLAACGMILAMLWMADQMPPVTDVETAAISVMIIGSFGAAIYGGALLLMWQIRGRPSGAETRVFEMFGLRRFSSCP